MTAHVRAEEPVQFETVGVDDGLWKSITSPDEMSGYRSGWAGSGLATSLHDLGVDDKTIQIILRHSNVTVTQKGYITSLPKPSQTAMEQWESALCAERAQKTEPHPAGRLLN